MDVIFHGMDGLVKHTYVCFTSQQLDFKSCLLFAYGLIPTMIFEVFSDDTSLCMGGHVFPRHPYI